MNRNESNYTAGLFTLYIWAMRWR